MYKRQEYMSSFALTGVEKEGLKKPEDKMKIWVCHNSWQRELQWQDYTLEMCIRDSTRLEDTKINRQPLKAVHKQDTHLVTLFYPTG